MKLTSGAVECLSRGAAHDDPDVNAVGPNGDLFEAGQMVTEGDAELRRSLDIDEHRPATRTFARAHKSSTNLMVSAPGHADFGTKNDLQVGKRELRSN